MSTEKQIEANRQNAQKSTGPRTDSGRDKAARNSLKHGFHSRKTVIAGEDYHLFQRFRGKFLEEMNPKGHMETLLAERIIDLSWRLQRAGRLQVSTYDELTAQIDPQNTSSPLGRLAIEDFGSAKVLDRLLMYERRLENSLYKTMLELQRLQFIRTKYQSLLMDGEDYSDIQFQELDYKQQRAYFDELVAFNRARRMGKDPHEGAADLPPKPKGLIEHEKRRAAEEEQKRKRRESQKNN